MTEKGLTKIKAEAVKKAPTQPIKIRTRDDTNEKKPSNWIQRTCVGPNCSNRQKSGRYVRKPGTADGDDQFLCFTCWSKDHVANVNRTCYYCQGNEVVPYKSTLWPGRDLCARCYEKERSARLSASGMKCWSCSATETSSKWRTSKDKSEGRKDLCDKCYKKEWRAIRRNRVSGV